MTDSALDIIVTNARIRTGQPRRPWATALGILDAKLAVVGSAAEILKMADSRTVVLNARGQQLDIPGGMAIGARAAVTVAPDGGITILAGAQA